MGMNFNFKRFVFAAALIMSGMGIIPQSAQATQTAVDAECADHYAGAGALIAQLCNIGIPIDDQYNDVENEQEN